MSDEEYISLLIEGIKKRENTFSKNVNVAAVNSIFRSMIKPIIALGTVPDLQSVGEKEKFALELFALTCFSKDNAIEEWSYSPILPNSKLTPDFLINNSQYVEVYSPINDLPKQMKSDFNRQKDQGARILNTGFHPTPLFRHQVAEPYLEAKSVKYHDYAITFLIHTIASGFSIDMINALKQVTLSSSMHHIVYYHGNTKQYYR